MMRTNKQTFKIVLSAAILLLLIFDTNTAAAGIADGIQICIKAIIPSVFPFLFVTSFLNSLLTGIDIPGLNKLGKHLHIPTGGESLLLLGFIGGYPLGAQMIADAYTGKKLDKRTGQILLGYCSNAGPAFIFGVAGALFPNISAPICLWIIHIFAAIVTGFLLPRPTHQVMDLEKKASFSIPAALQRSISVCISICGWIILFKAIMEYINVYLCSFLPKIGMIIFTGVLELSNGCLSLAALESLSIRFILCSGFFAFGGLCVLLQTISVTGSLKLGLYLHGKIMQTCISVCISAVCVYFLYPSDRLCFGTSIIIIAVFLIIIISTKYIAEKSCGNPVNNHV